MSIAQIVSGLLRRVVVQVPLLLNFPAVSVFGGRNEQILETGGYHKCATRTDIAVPISYQIMSIVFASNWPTGILHILCHSPGCICFCFLNFLKTDPSDHGNPVGGTIATGRVRMTDHPLIFFFIYFFVLFESSGCGPLHGCDIDNIPDISDMWDSE